MIRYAGWLGCLTLAVLVMGCSEPAPPGEGGPAEPDDTSKTPEINARYWINTEPLTLAGLRGKIVVLEFWATWCPPCRVTIPHLIEMHKTFADKGVVIVSLTEEPKDKVEPFAKDMGMTYAIGGGSFSGQAYDVRGIPHALLIAPSGDVVWKGHPMNGLDKAIEEQLAKTPPK